MDTVEIITIDYLFSGITDAHKDYRDKRSTILDDMGYHWGDVVTIKDPKKSVQEVNNCFIYLGCDTFAFLRCSE